MRFDRSKWANCKECPLRDRNRVWAEGPGSGPVPIVAMGEAPGRDEDYEGKPFVGAAGRTLNYALGRAGILRRAIWITNVISCRPTDNKSDTAEFEEAARCCSAGLRAELEYLGKRQVRVWMPLGNTACAALGVEGGITKIRGSVFQEGGRVILPTFHPAYIVRGQWKQEVTWVNDFEKAKRLTKKVFKAPVEGFNLYPTLQDLRDFLKAVRSDPSPLLGVDIETTSLVPGLGKILVVGLARDSENAISFPFYSKGMATYWNHKDAGEAKRILQSLLNFPTVFQNALFDIPHLEQAGYRVPNLSDDTLLFHHAIHPELPHTIGYIVSVYGSTPYWKDGVLGRLGRLDEVDDQDLRTYNLRDCVVLHQVLPGLQADIEEVGTESVYRQISMKLVRPIIDMTTNGMYIDPKKLKNWKAKLNREYKKLDFLLRDIAGVPPGFSFDSGDHLRLLIYGKVAPQFKKAKEELNKYEVPNCKLRRDTKKYKQICEKIEILNETEPLYIPRGYTTRRTTASGRLSTDEETLLGIQIGVNNRRTLVGKFVRPSASHRQELADLDRTLAFLVNLRRYNENAKLRSTYTTFPIRPDGRVHPQYLIHGTRTGRLSSRNPNAQNIPKEVRKIFTAPEGTKIVQADYSNLELRVLAYEAKDDVLINTFEKGENVHDRNTKDLFQIGPDHPQWDAARRAAKIYIFGRNYGGGPQGIYQRVVKEVPELGLTFERFRQIDNRYRGKHPRYTKWVRDTLAEVSKTRTLRNAFGRIRIFLGDAHEIEREGLNFPIQSAAADIINTALVSLYDDPKYRETGSKLIGQVHDSLVFEVPDGDIKSLVHLLRRHMEQRIDFRGQVVSFPVDIEVGPSWGGLKKWVESSHQAKRTRSGAHSASIRRAQPKPRPRRTSSTGTSSTPSKGSKQTKGSTKGRKRTSPKRSTSSSTK